MLVSNIHEIGDKLLSARKKAGLTQVEVAELAGLSDRTYADIERGETNMRVETLLRICRVLKITPDQVLTYEDSAAVNMETVLEELKECAPNEQNTAAKLLSVYLNSLK